jgi:hypothetical protein
MYWILFLTTLRTIIWSTIILTGKGFTHWHYYYDQLYSYEVPKSSTSCKFSFIIFFFDLLYFEFTEIGSLLTIILVIKVPKTRAYVLSPKFNNTEIESVMIKKLENENENTNYDLTE